MLLSKATASVLFAPTVCDFYKISHYRQYPENTGEVFDNLTARSDRLFKHKNDKDYDGKVVHYGTQGTLQEIIDLWDDTFFDRPKGEVLAELKRRLDTSIGDVDIQHFADLHDLGYLPIEVRALPEGARVPMNVPMMTIKSTLSDFFWVAPMLETIISCGTWGACTIATIANLFKRKLVRFANETGVHPDFCDYQIHDFSMRGMMGLPIKELSAHLLSAVGTDTIPAIDYLERYYDADCTQELIGCSVPATEHSVMCMGQQDTEIDTFRRMLGLYLTGIVSIVSDTWDFWQVIGEFTKTLKPEILARDGKVVFRPDSGNPVDILCGVNISTLEELQVYIGKPDYKVPQFYVERGGKYYEVDMSVDHDGIIDEVSCEFEETYSISEMEAKGAVEVLWDIFGGTETDKGYKVLDEHVGLIYGDSITVERAEAILQRLKDKGFASNNVVFGVGSYSYQYNTRDSFGFAIKATSGIVNGERISIQKDPKTDSGVKKSAKGLLMVKLVEGEYVLVQDVTEEQFESDDNELKVVMRNGEFVRRTSLGEIRDRLKFL